MKAKILFLALILAVIAAIFFLKTGQTQTLAAFYGNVYYHGEGCHCVYIPSHSVSIQKDGENPNFHRIRCGGQPGYSSDPYYYTAGWYTITVADLQYTGCTRPSIVRIYYNGVGQVKVDLSIWADNEQSRPQPGP
jgi:hypothetical protein